MRNRAEACNGGLAIIAGVIAAIATNLIMLYIELRIGNPITYLLRWIR